ncbi:MAG: tRNA pseudouridine(13) synthase TruD [Polyangiaceae bacterium]
MSDPTAEPRLPTAQIRSTPEDFVVDEIPAYAPSGQGEHVYITFRKVGLTTPEATKRIARALSADVREAGHAGMKDRHAVTTQTVSIQVPIAVDAERALAGAAIEGVEILGVARHGNKLKPGHLLGNRFRIVLREVEPARADEILGTLRSLSSTGVPNEFGPQRFGRDGDNPARALAWIKGEARGPRDRREQRLLFSALQSAWFNEVLRRREADGTWTRVLPGDLAKKTDTGGMFLVPLEGPEAESAAARGEAGELAPTGPMFGKKMRWPEGAPGELERAVLTAAVGDPACLEAWGHLGEGTRRALSMPVRDLSCALLPAASGGRDPARAAIEVCFTLPKGGYATTVLGRAARLHDATVARSDREQPHEAERLAPGDLSPHDDDGGNG